MPLPSSGRIRLSDVNVELQKTSTARISLSQSDVRTLFGVASGRIRMSNGFGKSALFTATITTNQQELNLRTWALANGWNGSSAAQITIASGVYIWSNNTAVAGLTTGSPWAGGLTIVNNGFIIGRGGNGGSWQSGGGAGGPALSLGVNCTITNNSYIAGGGGGGAGDSVGGGGGGAGGGSGGTSTGVLGDNAGGAGGAIGASGAQGLPSGGTIAGRGGGAGGGGGGVTIIPVPPGPGPQGAGGGGGGRILPGTGGSGGTGGSASTGGNGGSANSNGGASPNGGCGGGGGWGAPGAGNSVYGGGAGGRAVQLNGFTVTWNATGTRWGAIS